MIIILVVTAALLVVLVGVAALVLRSAKVNRESSLQLLGQQLSGSMTHQEMRLGQVSEQLANAIQNMTTNLNDRLGQSQQLTQQMQKLMNERLESSGKTIADLKEKLGQLGEATQNVIQVGTEVKKLQDILQRPTMRGGLGEWSLENILSDVLPQTNFSLQYQFKNGVKVDALVHLAQGNVAIDAKFPLANFQRLMEEKEEANRIKLRRAFLRDVCQRIDEIADKYILPEEGTLDFALMYVPAENVYYETVIKLDDKEPDVTAYGRRRHVIPVSPNTLYGYLMVVAIGLKGLQIEQNARHIRRQLSQFSSDMQLFINEFVMVGKHLNNAKNKYDEAGKKLETFNLRLQQIETHTESQIETE
ncbi:MAG: DNA recombination protein RmuC [Sedimentisphaerales bacterium]|nr:DNA recombination protein RmuC [Sedimentisphaerales bacterium]